jgi:hypothetical protein
MNVLGILDPGSYQRNYCYFAVLYRTFQNPSVPYGN